MKRKTFFVILSLMFAIFLSGCGTAPTLINLTGNWTITGTTTSGTSAMFIIGETRTDTCSIVDDNGALTISNFTSIGQEDTDWEVCYGTFTNPAFTIGPLNGSMMYNGHPVTSVVNFEGNMNDDGTAGTATWTATVKVDGVTEGNGGGTSVFTKD